MTGFLHEKEFSRKTFIKGGGALIVGFSLVGAGLAGKATADGASAIDPFASNGPGDMSQIDTWLTVHSNNTVSIKSGAIFQGTGSVTGVLMIAAEELDINMSQVIHVPDDTNVTANTGGKGASNTIYGGAGRGIRAAAASARQVLLGLAATQLGIPASQLSVTRGVVSGGGKSVSYGDLIGDKLFKVAMPASYNLDRASGLGFVDGEFGFAGGLQAGDTPAKPVSQYTLVGTSPPRVEIPAIVAGTFTYSQNIRVPGMLHGRVVRPLGQAVYGFGAPILSVDESSISHLQGARVVRKGDFLGVVAPHEYDAIQAAAQLKVKWADPPAALPGHGDEFAGMRALDSAGKSIESNVDLMQEAPNNGNVDAALGSAAHVVAQTYGWPSNVHTPIGPGCAVADVTAQGARIFAGTQGAYGTRSSIAAVLGLPINRVRVTAMPLGGTFGGSEAADTAIGAALMSQLAGAPVRLQLMRWDEIGWGNTGPGTLMDVRGGIDAKGNLVAFDFTHFYPQYKGGGDSSDQLAGISKPTSSSIVAGNYWPGTMYNSPNNRYLVKWLPLSGNWIKTAWFRAGSSPHSTFAAEQLIDELAHAAKMDPVAFRLQNVTQGNGHAGLLMVMDAATKAAGYTPSVSASQLSNDEVVMGRGVAWSNVYSTRIQMAAVADLSVNKKTGKVLVKHVYQAFTAGLAVYPDDVKNQMEGGITQILSRLLVEQFRYNKQHVTSTDFVSYPLLRFKDAPKVTAIVVSQPDVAPHGVGEPVTGAAAAAVANAFFDATGVRMRQAPMTPARVRATLKAAGVA